MFGACNSVQAGSCDGGPAAVAAALQQPVLEHIVTGNLHVSGLFGTDVPDLTKHRPHCTLTYMENE